MFFLSLPLYVYFCWNIVFFPSEDDMNWRSWWGWTYWPGKQKAQMKGSALGWQHDLTINTSSGNFISCILCVYAYIYIYILIYDHIPKPYSEKMSGSLGFQPFEMAGCTQKTGRWWTKTYVLSWCKNEALPKNASFWEKQKGRLAVLFRIIHWLLT